MADMKYNFASADWEWMARTCVVEMTHCRTIFLPVNFHIDQRDSMVELTSVLSVCSVCALILIIQHLHNTVN